jgi:hypothetical protein
MTTRRFGARSLRTIARALNERGIRTPRGVGEWKAGTGWRGWPDERDRMTNAELRAILDELHITQRAAARLFGHHRRSMEHWARGDRQIPPTLAIVLIVLRLLAAGPNHGRRYRAGARPAHRGLVCEGPQKPMGRFSDRELVRTSASTASAGRPHSARLPLRSA